MGVVPHQNPYEPPRDRRDEAVELDDRTRIAQLEQRLDELDG